MDKRSEDSLFTNLSFNINITIDDDQDGPPPLEKWAFAYHVSELSRRAFFALFKLLKNEALKIKYVDDICNEFGNFVNVLFQRFNSGDLDKRGSIEDSLQNYINNLKDYNYYIPKNMVNLGKHQIEPNDVGVYYDELETVITIFRDILRTLRDEKIMFWEKLFEEYKKDKEGYDLGFRTIVTRQEKDLENASKITSEDLKNIFRQKSSDE